MGVLQQPDLGHVGSPQGVSAVELPLNVIQGDLPVRFCEGKLRTLQQKQITGHPRAVEQP